jgi:hypothetical protein
VTLPFRMAACAALALAATALAGCGPYGLKGDRGLPPPAENVAYPNLNEAPPDGRRPLRSVSEQERIKAELLARKPLRR